MPIPVLRLPLHVRLYLFHSMVFAQPPTAVLLERCRADQESQQLSTPVFEAEKATRDCRAFCPHLVGPTFGCLRDEATICINVHDIKMEHATQCDSVHMSAFCTLNLQAGIVLAEDVLCFFTELYVVYFSRCKNSVAAYQTLDLIIVAIYTIVAISVLVMLPT